MANQTIPPEHSGGDKLAKIRNPDPPDWYEVKVAMWVQVQDPTDRNEITEALNCSDTNDFEILESEKV